MVLLTLLALGLLSLAGSSLRKSSGEAARAEARANARFGLMMALAEIQQLLGPDQRITAEAELRHDYAEGRSHWLGAYQSWLDTEPDRPEPDFLRWLVSGDREALEDESAAGGGHVADEMIQLLGNGSLGPNAESSDYVEAGLLPIGGHHRYAWWVGDESLKAHAPRSGPFPATPVAARGEMMSAPQTGLERLEAFGNLARDDERLARAISHPTLDLLAGQTTAGHFHDVTTDSLSLVTNVRKGGFRKDLSLALETSRNQRPTESLYEVQGKKGITLGELSDYYNLWKELDFQERPLAHPDGGTVPSGVPQLNSQRSHTQAVNDPYYAYRRLTILRNTWVISLMSREEATGDNSHQLYMVLDPILTVWNPFDVAIQVDRRAYQGFKYWGIPYRMSLTTGRETKNMNINDIVGGNFVMSALYGRVEPIVLRPGEVQVVSQGSDDQTKVGHSGMTTDLRLGWNFGSGFRFKLPTSPVSPDENVRWDMTPRSDGHMQVALIEFLHYQGTPGDTYGPDSVWVGGLMVDRNLDLGDRPLQASEASQYFPSLSSRRGGLFTVASIEDRKRPVMLISLDMKTEVDPIDEGLFQGRFHLKHNPKLSAYDIQSFDKATLASLPMQISVKQLNSWKDPILDVGATGLGYAGGGYTAQFGNSQIVTHSIPREPIHSLAAFQHAVANGEPHQYFSEHQTIADFFLHPSISHAIGNSFAPSFLAPDETEGSLNGSPAADHSYLANQALWDDWFFSSIAPQLSKSWSDSGKERSQRQVFEDFLGAGGQAPSDLPNRHIRPWVDDPEDAVDLAFDGTRPSTEGHARIGTHLMIEGGFNVNSCSVDAWRALLSSLRNRPVPVLDVVNGDDEQLEFVDGVPSTALLTPGGPAISDADLADLKSPLQWRGFRELKDDQIDELAEAIVRQVRERGPFLSLADFVNRRLGTDRELAASGALQAALDDEEVSINEDYLNEPRAISTAVARRERLPFPEAEAGAAAAGIPGYVKQADLLTAIGPQLSVRGDTFRVRAYGEARSDDGTKVLARAWCEALVQRAPEYLDSSDENWIPATELNSEVNQRLGRKLLVTRFRWLGSEEI